MKEKRGMIGMVANKAEWDGSKDYEWKGIRWLNGTLINVDESRTIWTTLTTAVNAKNHGLVSESILFISSISEAIPHCCCWAKDSSICVISYKKKKIKKISTTKRQTCHFHIDSVWNSIFNGNSFNVSLMG